MITELKLAGQNFLPVELLKQVELGVHEYTVNYDTMDISGHSIVIKSYLHITGDLFGDKEILKELVMSYSKGKRLYLVAL